MKTVTVVGNLTRDPELRFTNTGKAVASFGIAVNNRRRNPQTNEWEDGDAEFYDISAWDRLAENIAESLEKGERVLVAGRLSYRTWEADDGSKRSKVEIVAEEVGPSLRWATAKPQKNEKSSSNGDGFKSASIPNDESW